MPKIDPHTDLLPDEQALLDGKAIGADDDTGSTDVDDAAQSAAAAAAASDADPDLETEGTEVKDPPAAPAADAADPAAAAAADKPADEPAKDAKPEDLFQGYDVTDPSKFDEARDALIEKKATEFQKLMDGEIRLGAPPEAPDDPPGTGRRPGRRGQG